MIREVSFIIVNSIVPTYLRVEMAMVLVCFLFASWILGLVCFMDFRTMGGYFHSPRRWLDYKSSSFFFSFAYTTSPAAVMKLVVFFFFFSFAYTTSPGAVMKLVVFFFFFSFAYTYTTSPAAVMKLVFFFRSSKPPYDFWWSGVADGHCAIRLLHN